MKKGIAAFLAAVMAAVCVQAAVGGDVPEAWKKARTLTGVATRATPNPLQGAFELKCGKANKKGIAKVSAKLTGLDGKKKSYKAKGVDVTAGPVTVDLGGLSVTIDGDSFSGSESIPGGLSVESAKVGGALADGSHAFTIADFDLEVPGEVLEDLLPTDEKFDSSGGKWKFAKNASVKWAKPKKGAELPELYDDASGKGLIVDTSKGKTNLSSLKLSYKAKTGQFKGSFKAYELQGEGKSTKLKKYTIKVNGFVVDGKGVGQATCKKPAGGPWTVTVDAGIAPSTPTPPVPTPFTDDSHAKVQLWKDGPYWATTNIGAEKPEDYGYYFWWGDTVGYTRSGGTWTDGYYYSGVTWVSSTGEQMSNSPFEYSWCPTYDKSTSTLQSEGWITSDGVLAPEHDAAHVQWGGRWRMPTKQEFDNLNDNCDWTWATTNGVSGYVVRGKGDYASASIFLPAAGYGLGTSLYNAGSYGRYWSSVPGSGISDAWYFYFGSGTYYYGDRSYGQFVRPVQGFTE